MTERMSSADVAFLHRERRTAPQHVGQLAVFTAPPGGFDYDRLVRLLEERISLAPRYRQRVRMVPGNLANPVWLDDPAFDITYHVRRSALPRPGGDDQLLEFCGRIQSRLLDRSRPLWEMYLVEGLSGGRIAIVTKTHEAMVGEDDGIDLAQVILDAAPEPRRTVGAIWMPQPEPSATGLVYSAVRDVVRRPLALADPVRGVTRTLGHTMGRLGSATGGVISAAGAVLQRPQPSPLQVTLSEQRRMAIARTRLDDYRRVREAFGGAVNDVALAVVSGALRGWLLSRAEALRPATTVRALVPMSVAGEDERREHPAGRDRPRATAGRVRPLLVDLPVGEPDAVLRLAQLRYAMATHRASDRAVGADRIAALSGFAPPTLHALGARAAAGLTRRMFSLVVTNVPGPQLPLYAAGARMTEMFPFLPLAPGQALSIALTSYDGGVFYGINGDRDAMRDVAVFADLVEESLAELVAATETAAVAAAGRRPEPAETDR
jgi:diacylglycerol O-acyltransferase / wax synthase